MASSEIGEHLNQQASSPAAEGNDDEAKLKAEKEAQDRGDTVLFVYRGLSIVTAISALLCGIANVISAVQSFKYGDDIFVGLLRCYAVVLALFVAVAETEWERIFKFWRVLEYWVGRGMLQIFVAIMTKALAHSFGQSLLETKLHEAVSWALFVCGVVYVVSGLLCIGVLKKSRVRKANWRKDAVKDLEEVERKRKELQGLLSDHV